MTATLYSSITSDSSIKAADSIAVQRSQECSVFGFLLQKQVGKQFSQCAGQPWKSKTNRGTCDCTTSQHDRPGWFECCKSRIMNGESYQSGHRDARKSAGECICGTIRLILAVR